MIKNFLVFVFTGTSILFADLIIYDKNFSPYAGGQDLITGDSAILDLQDRLSRPHPENNFLAKLDRLINQVLISTPLNLWVTIFQHEVFGHGYRIRDIGSANASVTGYQIVIDYPFGGGSGATNYRITDQLTIQQMVAIQIAGTEATAILANQLKNRWIKSRHIKARQGTLYIYSQQDLLNYVYSTPEQSYTLENGNDITAYIYWMNLYFPNCNLTLNELKSMAWINLLDPMTFYSVYQQISYIFTGEEVQIPMISAGKVDFLPNLRYSLSPSGPEVYVELFSRIQDDPLYVYFKWGNYTGIPSYGVGFEHPRCIPFFHDRIGLRLNLFRELVAENNLKALDYIVDPSKEQALESYGGIKTRYGYSFHFLYSPTFGQSSIQPHLELGYKSHGFVQGESLVEAVILRGGLEFSY